MKKAIHAAMPAVKGIRALLPPEKRNRTKVGIVGFCQGSRDLMPYDDPDMLAFGLNKGGIFMPRGDVWFELHGPKIYKWEIRRPHKHTEWMKAFNGPVYMHEADPEIPNSVAYPLKEIADDVFRNIMRLTAENTLESYASMPYLTSSIALQMALAIHEQFSEIHLYGIDLNTDSEYAWQKAGVEHLIGVAAGRGIKVVVPDACALLKGKIYGRGFMKPEGEAHSVSQFEVRLKSIRERREKLTVQVNQQIGARNECGYILNQMPPGLDHEKLSDRQRQLSQAVDQSIGELNQLVGQEREVLYWISMTPEGQDPQQAIQQVNEKMAQPEAQLSALKAKAAEQPPEVTQNGHVEADVKELVEVA